MAGDQTFDVQSIGRKITIQLPDGFNAPNTPEELGEKINAINLLGELGNRASIIQILRKNWQEKVPQITISELATVQKHQGRIPLAAWEKIRGIAQNARPADWTEIANKTAKAALAKLQTPMNLTIEEKWADVYEDSNSFTIFTLINGSSNRSEFAPFFVARKTMYFNGYIFVVDVTADCKDAESWRTVVGWARTVQIKQT